MALWGFFQWFRGEQPSGSYLAALIIGEALIIVQALSGLLLVAAGHHPRDGLHWLYGVILVLTLPVVSSAWAQKATDRRAALYYGLACTLIVIVAVVRASGTG